MEDRSLDGFFAGCGFAGGLFAVCVELGVEEVAFEEVERRRRSTRGLRGIL